MSCSICLENLTSTQTTGNATYTKLLSNGLKKPKKNGLWNRIFSRRSPSSVKKNLVTTPEISSNDDCDIIVTSLCGHVYHRSCIVTWCERRNSDCPICRQSINPQTLLQLHLNIIPAVQHETNSGILVILPLNHFQKLEEDIRTLKQAQINYDVTMINLKAQHAKEIRSKDRELILERSRNRFELKNSVQKPWLRSSTSDVHGSKLRRTELFRIKSIPYGQRSSRKFQDI